ncbi:hypothetical protein ABT084_30430 [Streptomyces sp. NPDC002138]|uniref:hypothetical protein n=1 Tax=Streptomyces sp. NPDC002138 TaxID=3154410 RepID=UPI003323597D
MEPHAQELKKDFDATLKARGELGAEYEAALVDSFIEKVDTQVRRRLAEQRLHEVRGGPAAGRSGGPNFAERFGFAIVTLVLAIPLSAIGVVNAGLTGLLISWAGILGVNLAHTKLPHRHTGD